MRGSWTGQAVHVHTWWVRTKCSAANICTGAPSASAVPIALLPTTPSDQSAPSVNPSASARWRTAVEPSRQSSTPSASVTTMMCRASSATEVNAARSSGSTRCSGERTRRCSTSSSGERTGRVAEVGIHALRPRPHPRAGDEPPRIGGRAVAGEQGVVDAREHSRVPDDVRARPDRADRLVHPHHPEPPD